MMMMTRREYNLEWWSQQQYHIIVNQVGGVGGEIFQRLINDHRSGPDTIYILIILHIRKQDHDGRVRADVRGVQLVQGWKGTKQVCCTCFYIWVLY